MNIIINDSLRQNILQTFINTAANLYLVFSDTYVKNTSRSAFPTNMKLAVRLDEYGSKIERLHYAIRKEFVSDSPALDIINIDNTDYYITDDITGFEDYNWNSLYVMINIPALDDRDITLEDRQYNTISLIMNLVDLGGLQDYYPPEGSGFTIGDVDFSEAILVSQYCGSDRVISNTTTEAFNILIELEQN